MTVYFSNDGLIDMDVIRVMGVSVKENDSPIGYFGTGLKFAIATLLRTGHKMRLVRGGEVYEFTGREVSIRNREMLRVYMNDEPLPFTTELGKNWAVWQAYRELHSNTLDEMGTISNKKGTGDTVFEVDGAAIEREYHNRYRIFVESAPLAENSSVEIHEGPSQYVYYRGVRAGALPEPSMFKYNILGEMTLTEDRTFSSEWDVEWRLASAIPRTDNKGVFMQLLSSADKWDQNLSFDNCSTPSAEFIEAAKANYSNLSAPKSARRVVEKHTKDSGDFKLAKLSDAEQDKFLSAFKHLQGLGCSLSPEDVEIVETLGPSCMGLYHSGKGQVYLAHSTLDWGMETIVATLYEEWLHKEHHFRDYTREFQNFLIQRLVALSMEENEEKQ